jgi:protein-tyrosine-phosphatase
MKVLFVCRSNVGRSQAAMALYNKLIGNDAISAGIEVDDETKRVGERKGAEALIEALKSEGVDISSNTSKQVTKDIVANTDKIITLVPKSLVPEWLKVNPKVIIWDTPEVKDASLEEAKLIVRDIKKRVLDLK